jgi:hypothetical protein
MMRTSDWILQCTFGWKRAGIREFVDSFERKLLDDRRGGLYLSLSVFGLGLGKLLVDEEIETNGR